MADGSSLLCVLLSKIMPDDIVVISAVPHPFSGLESSIRVGSFRFLPLLSACSTENCTKSPLSTSGVKLIKVHVH